jgi:hypothetical protein
MDPKKNLLTTCESALRILSSYYTFHSQHPIEQFLMEPLENTSQDGQVLFEENDEDVFIGIQFSKKIIHPHDSNFLSPHQVSIIAEELSHFKLLSDCVQSEKKTSLLKLETLGEIDRFLCVMHWNSFELNSPKINRDWKNIHEICDTVFTGNRFKDENNKIYIEAENLAFKHLKNYFAQHFYSYLFIFYLFHIYSISYVISVCK